ncbi:hypothetical protein KJZ99_08580 [bacterium]|nr:hypothetical protein [bacterium]
MFQNLDDPDDKGRAFTEESVAVLNEDNYPRLGQHWYREEVLNCYRDQDDPSGFCDSAIVRVTASGELLLKAPLGPCGRWRIWYVVDSNPWFTFCGGNNDPEYGVTAMRCFMFQPRLQDDDCAGIDTNLVAYLQNVTVMQMSLDVNLGECEEYPPFAGEVKTDFLGYIDSQGNDGRSWLPTPGDSIGLVFQFSPDSSLGVFDIRYHIWDMSMWQGECMNSPRFDDSTRFGQRDTEPHTMGFSGPVPWDSLDKFRYWDYTVGYPEKYGYYVFDTVQTIASAPGNYWFLPGDTIQVNPQPNYPFPAGRELFKTDIIAYIAQANVEYDTLWLKALDYGAHSIVTPEVGPGKDRRMKMWHPDSAYIVDSLWSITVPFDYDGYYDAGVNYGDCMSDAWESRVAKYWQGSSWVPIDIRYFRPFVTPFLGITDYDIVPQGRLIDGDSLCNFAEYRGLMITDDSTDTSAGNSHRRLDPRKKSVIVHVRNDMGQDPNNREVLDLMPGFIYKSFTDTAAFDTVNRIDTLEILFTDSIRFSPTKYRIDDQATIENVRLMIGDTDVYGRDINFNRVGASLWYFGLGYPSPYPMSKTDTVRAVTFWTWRRDVEYDEMIRGNANPETDLGITWQGATDFGTTDNGASIPNNTARSIVNLNAYANYRDLYVSDSLWQVDFPFAYSRTIAHEFGHTVGMLHQSDNIVIRTIMSKYKFLSTRRFFLTSTDSTYSDESKAQISIKERKRRGLTFEVAL